MPQTAKRPSAATGTFDRSTAYTFAELRKRGFGACALREMQRRGLRTREVGRIKVVLGEDLIEFFEKLDPVTL